MDLNRVEAFTMGFFCAILTYCIIRAMAWIEAAHGMDREGSLALVERTNGKTAAEVSEMIFEGHKLIEEKALLRQRLEAETAAILMAAEIEKRSNRLATRSLDPEENSAKAASIH